VRVRDALGLHDFLKTILVGAEMVSSNASAAIQDGRAMANRAVKCSA